jgi:hypothetical protein
LISVFDVSGADGAAKGVKRSDTRLALCVGCGLKDEGDLIPIPKVVHDSDAKFDGADSEQDVSVYDFEL